MRPHKILSTGFIVAFALTMVCLGMRPVYPADLKAVSYLAKNHPNITDYHELIKMLNDGLKGKSKIIYTGGPETIPAIEQIEAVKNNVVQLATLPIAYHSSHTPVAATMILAKVQNAMELRNSPYHKIISDDYERIGVKYLGATTWGSFHTWISKPARNIDDLKGLKMRSFFIYDRFLKALQTTPVNMPAGDLYTALERGVVDGACYTLLGPRQDGLTKFLKYIIPYPFYCIDIMTIMNLDTWKKLGPEGQKIVEETIAQKYEPYMTEASSKNLKNEWDELAKAGVSKISFSDTEAKKYVDMAYRVKWEEYSEKLPADVVKNLQKAAGE